MNFETFQQYTGETITYPTDTEEASINYCVLGLTGEAGEISEKWKKVIRDNEGILTPEIREAMALEVGDVLWYVARLAAHLGYSLEDIAHRNVQKLESRKQRDVLRGSGDNR